MSRCCDEGLNGRVDVNAGLTGHVDCPTLALGDGAMAHPFIEKLDDFVILEDLRLALGLEVALEWLASLAIDGAPLVARVSIASS